MELRNACDVFDFGMIASEMRRMAADSNDSVLLAAMVFNFATKKKDVELRKIATSSVYRRLVNIALIVVRRFCRDPAGDVRKLVSMMNWTKGPHVGHEIFIQVILGDLTVRIDCECLERVRLMFPTIFEDFVRSRIYAAPETLCPKAVERPAGVPSIEYFSENGCSGDTLRVVVKVLCSQAYRVFAEEKALSGSKQGSPAVFDFVLDQPKMLPIIRQAYRSEDIQDLIINVLEKQQLYFVARFLLVAEKFPRDFVSIVVDAIKRQKRAMNMYAAKLQNADVGPLVRFLCEHRAERFFDKINETHTELVVETVHQFLVENPDRFASLCGSSNSEKVTEAILRYLSEKSLHMWDDNVIIAVLEKQQVWKRLLEVNEEVLKWVIYEKPHLSVRVTSLISNFGLEKSYDIRQVLYKSREWEALRAMFDVSERSGLTELFWHTMLCENVTELASCDVFSKMVADTGVSLSSILTRGIPFILRNPAWKVPLTNVFALFEAIFPVLCHRYELTHDEKGCRWLIGFEKELIERFVDNNFELLNVNCGVFLSLTGLFAPRVCIVPFSDIALEVRLKLMTCVESHSVEGENVEIRWKLFSILRMLFGDHRISESMSPPSRAVIVSLITRCLYEGVLDDDVPDVIYILLKCSSNQPESGLFTGERREHFVFAIIEGIAGINRILRDQPQVRYYLLSMIVGLPDNGRARMLSVAHERNALPILCSMMLTTLGDFSDATASNVEFLLVLNECLKRCNPGSELVIARNALRVIIMTTRSENEHVSILHAEILDTLQNHFATHFAKALVEFGTV